MLPTEFAFSKSALLKIVDALQKTATELETARDELVELAPTPFGGSWYGDFVRGHSQKAYDAINEALADNAKALNHYEQALRIVDKNATAAEDASAAALAAQRQRAEDQVVFGNDCADSGAGNTAPVCEAP